jgi:23S rRNA (pseudouridine1915-N3)-methyltransferase
MELNLVCVGSLKEEYWNDAVNEYKKRLGAFAKINIIEIKEKTDEKNLGQVLQNKLAEAKILDGYKSGYNIALEINGNSYSSLNFAKHLQKLMTDGNSTITFFVGGSNGLDEKFSKSLNEQISFSKMTFPHHLMRVILLEQIYRAFSILNNKSYHK